MIAPQKLTPVRTPLEGRMNASQLADLLIEIAKEAAEECGYGVDLACMAERLLGLPVGKPNRPYQALWVMFAAKKLAEER